MRSLMRIIKILSFNVSDKGVLMTVLFIVSLKYVKPISEVEKHLEAHKAWLEDGYAAGHFIMSGRKIPRNGGIIIARAENLLALSDILNLDPFQVHGISTVEITAFEASKMFVENLTL